MKSIFKIMLLLNICAAPAYSAIGLIISLDSFGYTSQEKQGIDDRSSLTLEGHGMLGVVLADIFVIGGGYYLEQVSQKSEQVENSRSFASLGATVGIKGKSSPFYLGVSMLLFPTLTTKSTHETILFDGSGFAIDVAYHFALGGFFVGPALQYRKTTFKKNSVDSKVFSLANEKSLTKLTPLIAFGFQT